MKNCDLELINFLKKYGGWQWYSNDRQTGKIVNRLVNRGYCTKKMEILDNGYKFKTVKLNQL